MYYVESLFKSVHVLIQVYLNASSYVNTFFQPYIRNTTITKVTPHVTLTIRSPMFQETTDRLIEPE